MEGFEKNIISIYGRRGKQWLAELPDLVNKIVEKYNLTKLTPVKNMSFNYVARGCQHDKPVILKIGLNSNAFSKELSCLKAFVKHSAAEVIADDDNMMILQCAVPGTRLKDYFPTHDTQATKVVCSVIKKMHLADILENHCFDRLCDVLKILDRKLDIPDGTLSKARILRDNLLNSTNKEVLLHGDLHHDNLLKNGEGWLIIDPKGFIGDPAFELAAYLCNPMPKLIAEDNVRKIIANRIYVLAEQLDIPEKRITDWLYVKSVLCWAWCLDDNLDPGYWPKFLEII